MGCFLTLGTNIVLLGVMVQVGVTGHPKRHQITNIIKIVQTEHYGVLFDAQYKYRTLRCHSSSGSRDTP